MYLASEASYGQCNSVEDAYPDTISKCHCFIVIAGYATKSPTYLKIVSEANITLSDLMRWNSWFGPNCDEGILPSKLTVLESFRTFTGIILCLRPFPTSRLPSL
ncbi:hypothetical protein BKA63DRAFT_485971 [Paraphoma chrysanthemicola]|nr:hypothetical protein BKA63DRAFT_485971 [Paraphoma chrysanthemicola]